MDVVKQIDFVMMGDKSACRLRSRHSNAGDSNAGESTSMMREASEKEMRLDALRVAFARAMRAVEQSRPLVCADDKRAAEAMNSARGSFVPFRDPVAGRNYLKTLLVHDNILQLLTEAQIDCESSQ